MDAAVSSSSLLRNRHYSNCVVSAAVDHVLKLRPFGAMEIRLLLLFVASKTDATELRRELCKNNRLKSSLTAETELNFKQNAR